MTVESVQVETQEPEQPRACSVLHMGWGVTDQAVSSISDFLLGIFVAKTLGTEVLGAPRSSAARTAASTRGCRWPSATERSPEPSSR